MIVGLQVIALLFALTMLYFTYLHYKRKELEGWEGIFSLISWLGAIFIILFPNIVSFFAEKIAISRAFDLAVIGGFILMIPMVYMSYIKVRRLEKKLEEVIRNESLKSIKNDRKNK